MSLPKVAVCVLNYNRKEILMKCLKAVDVFKYPVTQVLMVDNHSTDGSVQAVKSQFPNVQIVINEQNYGPAIGKNIGLKKIIESNLDYVLLLDNDIIADHQIINLFMDIAEKEHSAGILGPKIYNLEKPNEFFGAGCIIDYTQNIGYGRGVGMVDQGQFDQNEEMDSLLGGAMFIRIEALRKVGLFDSHFRGFWYEGQDLCFRMKKAGYKNIYVHQCKVWHKPHSDVYSYRRKYLAARNAIYFMKKHGSIACWVKFIFYSVGGLFYAFIRETPRGNFMGVVGKARGLIDGFLGIEKHALKLLHYNVEA